MGDGPKPRSVARSVWTEQPANAAISALCGPTTTWRRNVHDGHLVAIVSLEHRDGPHLHLSISHQTNARRPKPGRYPTWDEIADARYTLLPEDLTFAMVLPPPSTYVAFHPTTFYLHQTDCPHLVEDPR